MYLWFKVMHIFSVMAWMVGLWYLPRLYVYHCGAQHKETKDTLLRMQKKLLTVIMLPAMLLVWFTGLSLAIILWPLGAWFHAKFLLVVILTGYHGYLFLCHKHFNNGLKGSAIFYKILNEVPTLLVICIIVLVIVRPF